MITQPNDNTELDDNHLASRCRIPHLVQTRRNHKHYGCVALVESGLLLPRYVHGDYDLHSIIPAGQNFSRYNPAIRHSTTAVTAPGSLGLQERLRRGVTNMEDPLSLRVATYINTYIAKTGPDLLGALMVNHGEVLKTGQYTFDPVLAFMPKQVNGPWARILATREDHARFHS